MRRRRSALALAAARSPRAPPARGAGAAGRAVSLPQPGAHPDRLAGGAGAARRGGGGARPAARRGARHRQRLRGGGAAADRAARRRCRRRSSASSPTTSTPRVVAARREQDERSAALAAEFDRRRRQFYARVAPILVELMDRYRAQAIFDENSVLLADQALNITAAVIAEIDARAAAAPDRSRAPRTPPPPRRPASAAAAPAPATREETEPWQWRSTRSLGPGGHPRDQAHDPAPLSVPPDRPGGEHRQEPLGGRHQERHRQRAAFRGALPGAPGDAGRADHRGDGADLGGAGGRDARADRQRPARLLHEHRERQVPPAWCSPATRWSCTSRWLRGRGKVWKFTRRRRGSATRSAPRPSSRR